MIEHGQAIGLFGGSFNPAHGGHLHVAKAGLRELQLDAVHWLVSPQNPLKPKQPSWGARAQTVRDLPLPPRMQISDVERRLGTQYTIDLLRTLTRRDPATRYVFLMGADNLLQMPRWRAWEEILSLVPIAVIARPGTSLKARLGQVARQYADARVPEAQAHSLKDFATPAWTYLTLPLDNRSSSAIRAKS
jgi:nicotinate-nucleotide adenylyltransferase